MTTLNNNNFKNEWLEWATNYVDFGFSIIPIGTDKQPIVSWKEFQSRKPSLEELKKWSELSNLQGMAIITGKLSGVFVLDIDEGGKVEDLPQTPIVRTGSGIHYYFKYPNNIEVKNTTGLRPKVDIRGEGGYAILPPTIHPNGKQYKWLLDLNTPIAQAPDWLLKELTNRSGNSGPLPAQVYEGVEEGSRNTVATHIIGKLFAHLPPKDWLSVAWPLLMSWNEQNNRPPLSTKELTTIFKSISEKALISSSQRHDIYTNDEVTDDFSFFTLKELMENEAIKTSWLVDQLIPEQGITCLAARMKTGKSYLTIQLAKCLTEGSDLFGKFKVKKTGVFIINKEDTENLIKERLNQLKVDKNLPILFSTDQRIFFHHNRYFQKILDFSKRNNIGLIIADSFRRFFKGDENSSMEIRPLHQFFKSLTQNGLTVLFTHHYGKDSDGKNDGDKMRGSSDIGAMIDSAIALERTNEKIIKVVQIESRYTKKHPPFNINFPTFEGDDCQFKFLNSLEEEKTLEEIIKERIIELLTPVGKELYVGQFEILLNQDPLTKCGHGTISKYLQDLALTNQLIFRRDGTKTYYKLPQNQPSHSHPINTTDGVTKES